MYKQNHEVENVWPPSKLIKVIIERKNDIHKLLLVMHYTFIFHCAVLVMTIVASFDKTIKPLASYSTATMFHRCVHHIGIRFDYLTDWC